MGNGKTTINKGFTLIEILVVLIIITITTTVALLSVNQLGESYQAQQLAKKLKLTLAYLHNQALAQATPYALAIKNNGLAVYKMKADQQSYLWQSHALPQQLLIVNQQRFQLRLTNAVTISPIPGITAAPGLIITEDGATAPFTIIISNQQGQRLYSLEDDAQDVRIIKAN